MKKWWFLILLVLLLKPVLGSVVIQEVLYDPATAESGGEAVLLYNQDNVSVDISGWTLATEASSSDVTLPPDTVLFPKAFFLIGDSGWENQKGELPSADYEEIMLLGNTNAGIALQSNGITIDAVGWGSPSEGLYQGTPHDGVTEGKSLRRINSTGDNAHDFIESDPLLTMSSGLQLPIIIIVNETQTSYADLSLDIDKIEILDAMPGETRTISTTITNNGNIAVDLIVQHDLADIQISLSQTHLEPGQSSPLDIQIQIPTTPGRYEGMLNIDGE